MTIVIDQGVLERATRAPIPRTTIEDQLTHVLDISSQDNITINVLPLTLRRRRFIADSDLPGHAVISMGIPLCSFTLTAQDDGAWSLFMPTVGDTVVRSHDPDYTLICAEQFGHTHRYFCLGADESRTLIATYLARLCRTG
jgi:hypothetical protein